MEFVLFFVVIIGVAAVFMASFVGRRRAWAELARAHQLELGGWYFWPVLEGRFRGHRIQVSLERRSRRAGRNDGSHTRYRVTIAAPMPSGFSVRKEGLLQLLGKVVGMQDITIGDPELDDALLINGNDMVGIIRLLNIHEVGAAVLGMVIAYPDIEIGQSIAIEERGMADGARITAMLDELCELARALEEGYERLVAEDGGASPWAAG
jgi:hypothetical protein